MTNFTNAQPSYGQPSSPPPSMAPKTHTAHRQGGLVRSHSRGSSGGGSRLGLSQLQLTQKDSAPAKHPDRTKKSHLHHELQGNKSATHLARSSSNVRIHSREHLNPAALRRAPPPLARGGSKQKVGFTISSPSEEDDEAWVSSESGAATPSHESDVEEVSATPVDKRKLQLPLVAPQLNGATRDEFSTPRAETPSLPRVETIRPSQGSLAGPLPPRDALPQPPAQVIVTHPTPQPPPPRAAPNVQQPVQRILPEGHPTSQSPPSLPPPAKARSETHSPPRRSPDALKRQSMTRPPSTNSMTGSSAHSLRPHPLIRAHSAGHGALLRPAKPAPLAPLTTVPTEPIPAQMSTSSASPTSLRASSPTLSLSMQTNGVSPVLSQPSPSGSEASKQLRRTSTSSRSSAATLPALPLQSSATQATFGRATNHDRLRTLSTSSTHTYGALSNLSNLNMQMRPTPSPPKTPIPHVTVFFPPNEQTAQWESVHNLLPPPYLSAHLTMLAYRNPLAESYNRVSQAKKGR